MTATVMVNARECRALALLPGSGWLLRFVRCDGARLGLRRGRSRLPRLLTRARSDEEAQRLGGAPLSAPPTSEALVRSGSLVRGRPSVVVVQPAAQTRRTPSTTHRRASPSTGRARSKRRTRRRPHRSPRRASPALAPCGAAHARARCRRRCQSIDSPPQTCHRRFAYRTPPRCHAQDAPRARPTARAHGLDARRARDVSRRGSDRHRRRARTSPSSTPRRAGALRAAHDTPITQRCPVLGRSQHDQRYFEPKGPERLPGAPAVAARDPARHRARRDEGPRFG